MGPRVRRAEQDDAGGTLPEVLLVVAVLAILAGTVAIAVGRLRDDAVATACEAERSTLERAAALWLRDADVVPTSADLVDAGLIRGPASGFEVDATGEVVATPGGPCGDSRAEQQVAGGTVSEAGSSDGSGGGSGGSGVGTGGGSGGGSADVAPEPTVETPLEFALAWTGNADLDVFVRAPSGEVIARSTGAFAGGSLEADVVPPEPEAVGPHVERVTFPAGAAAVGNYEVWAYFRTGGWGDQPSATFVLTVRRGDEVLGTLEGPVGAAESWSNSLQTAIIA